MRAQLLRERLRTPEDLAHYQRTGELPAPCDKPKPQMTPLQRLLESIHPEDLKLMPAVRMSPYLGYGNVMVFNHPGVLLSWLHTSEAREYILPCFENELTICDLDLACVKPIPEELYDRYTPKSRISA